MNSLPSGLLQALDLAVFEMSSDGAFVPLGHQPDWFVRLGRDGTFPFLGHTLEDAHRFWASKVEGRKEWGPCADVDEGGTEFHYLVKALNIEGRHFLAFQLDPAADRMREVLRKVRTEMLESEMRRGKN